jgi:hypothetical protein
MSSSLLSSSLARVFRRSFIFFVSWAAVALVGFGVLLWWSGRTPQGYVSKMGDPSSAVSAAGKGSSASTTTITKKNSQGVNPINDGGAKKAVGFGPHDKL